MCTTRAKVFVCIVCNRIQNVPKCSACVITLVFFVCEIDYKVCMATPHPFPSHPVPADPTIRDRVTAVDLRNSMQIETGDEAEGASLTPKTHDNTLVSVPHEVTLRCNSPKSLNARVESDLSRSDSTRSSQPL